MQYIPTDLPQYWKIHPRSDFSDALVQEDHVLIFSQDGQSLTVKKPDGTFEVLSGSNSGAVQMGVQAGVIVRQNGVLKFQPLSFDGTTASFSNSAQEYTSKIFNTTMEEPAYGGSSGTPMEFYKCTAIQSSDSIAYYTVSGAGTQRCNGAYYKFGTWYSYPSYYHVDSNSQILYMYHLSGGYWVIYPTFQSGFVNTTDAIYYRISSDNTGSWQKGTGSNPAPTVAGVYGSNTWSGRKAVLNEGVYSFQSNSTEGLTYTDIVPQVSKTYSADTLVQADLYTGIPTRGLKLYIPFDYGIYAKTGQTITQTNFPASSGTFKGVPSTLFTGTCQFSVVPWANWLTNNDSFTIFIWVTYTYPSTAQSRAINAMQETGSTELSIACWGQAKANAYLSNVARGIYGFASDTWWWGCISHDAATNAVQITNSQGSTSGTVTLTTSDNNLYIAGSANQGSSTRHQGRLAALRVYDRVLTPTQITALANEFTPIA